jgi:hypothetical protein
LIIFIISSTVDEECKRGGGTTAADFRSIPNKSQDSLGGTANTADSKSVSNGISVRIR